MNRRTMLKLLGLAPFAARLATSLKAAAPPGPAAIPVNEGFTGTPEAILQASRVPREVESTYLYRGRWGPCEEIHDVHGFHVGWIRLKD